MTAPRSFVMVEELSTRKRSSGGTFYRAAVLEKGAHKVVDLYCRNELKEVLKKLQRIEQGQSFIAGALDGADSLSCHINTGLC